MTREEFDALVARIERRYHARPLALKLRVALVVALGYSAALFSFGLVLVLALAFVLGAVAIETGVGLILAAIGALLLTVGSLGALELLWMTLKAPEGRDVKADEAPHLFALLGDLRASARAPGLHRVIFTPEFNAGVTELPRLGMFGWCRSVLVIGLSLMESLAPKEFEAVMAHEFAHLSGRHGRFSAWIYRLQRTWERIVEEFQQPAKSQTNRWIRAIVRAFLGWYWPRFRAYAMVLSREDEYAADRESAERAGAANAAGALWRIECLSRRWNDEVQKSMWELAASKSEPPTDFTSGAGWALRQIPAKADADRWMEQSINNLTDNLHTHPSFADRVAALGFSADQWSRRPFPLPAEPSAATVLMQEGLQEIRQDVDACWRRMMAELWRRRHGRAMMLKRQMTGLAPNSEETESDVVRLWERATMLQDLQGTEAAVPVLERILDLCPSHSRANLVLGMHLLERGAAEGEEFLGRILAEEDDELIPQACEVLSQHFRSIGNTVRVQDIHRHLSQYETASQAAARERSVVTASDRFIPHDLTDDELRELHRVLGAQPELDAAWLVRKEMKHFSRRRLFVLCVRSRVNLFRRSRAEPDERLVRQLVPLVRLPGRVLVVAPQGIFRALGRKIMRQPGSQVFPPESSATLFSRTNCAAGTTEPRPR